MTHRRQLLGRAAVFACALGLVAPLGSTAGAPASADVLLVADQDGTVRVEAATDATGLRAGEATELVAAMTTRQRAATVVMGHVPTTDADALRAYMTEDGLGGFILMGPNIPGAEADLRALTASLTIDARLPPLIAIDQEGGDVSRLPWDGFPSATTLKDADPSAVRAAFAARGALLQRVGISVNFGIVGDVTDDPGMFIYRRALGTTPTTGAAHVAAAVEGEADGALSTLKHFPGHGAAPGDSHTTLPVAAMAQSEWAKTDALPFAAGIDAGAALLMFGHLRYTAVDEAPATLSAAWHRIARDDLGFTGVAITDDLGMLQATGIPAYSDPVANAVAALVAGNDMVLAVMFTTHDSASRIIDGIVAAVDAGTLPAERLEEAASRVTALRLRLAAEGRGLMPCTECDPAGP